MIPHILTNQSLTVLLDSRSIAIPRSHVNFDAILDHLNDNDPAELRLLLDVKQSVADFMQGKIEIHDRVLTYAGQEINTGLTRKIIEFMRSGETNLAGPLVNFLDKVMNNPSRRAVQGLYDWVAASNMPIAADGDIYAWKIVNDAYLDYYSQTLDHTPGNVVTQPRNQCDEDPDSTCSYGIHFCSFNYLPHYRNGDDSRRIMLVKIDPADVVAIPRDYNTAKGRCCKLTVIQQVPQEEVESFFPTRTVYVPAAPGMSRDNYRGFAIDQVWRDDDGDLMTVIHVDYDDGVVECSCNGDSYEFDFNGDSSDDSRLWLAELISDKPSPSVGQVWLDNDGDEQIILEVGEVALTGHCEQLGAYYFFAPDGSALEGRNLRLVSKVR